MSSHFRALNSGSYTLLPVLPLFVFVLLLPVLGSLVPGPVTWTNITLFDWQRIAQIVACIACISLSIIFPQRGVLSYPSAKAIGWLLLIVAAGWMSAATNAVPWFDVAHEVALQTLLLLAFWSVWLSFSKAPETERRHVASFCMGSSALLYVAVFLWLNQDSFFSLMFMGDPPRIAAFSNVRFFSDYQVVVLPFLIHWVSETCQRRISRIAGWCWIFLFCMIFFYTGSRSVVLGQVGIHVVLFFILRRRYLPILRRHVIAWFGGWLYFLFFSQFLPALFSIEPGQLQTLLRGDSSSRDILWGMSLDMMMQHPWLGIGPGEFARQLNSVAASPHNSLLMLGVEWGWAVLLLSVFCFGKWSAQSLVALKTTLNPSSANGDFAIACWLACGALFWHSLVVNVLGIPSSAVGLVLSAGMASATTIGNVRVLLRDEARLRRFSSQSAYFLLVMMTVGLNLVILAVDVPNLPARNSAYLNCKRPTPFYSPRFWQQGWLIGTCPSPDTRVGVAPRDKT